MKAKQVLYFFILLLLFYIIYGAASLSIVEFQESDVCPKVLSIPACYIVLTAFTLVCLFHILPIRSKNWYFFTALFIPFSLALGGTITELSGTVVCPRTPGGTPMCYISLGFCILLYILKTIEIKLQKD